MRLHLRTVAVVCVLGVLAAFAFAACGDDDDHGDESAGAIAAITYMDAAGLHTIDQSINTDKTIPPTARSTALKLQTVALLTEWPSDVSGDANTLAGVLGDLAAALDGDNPDLARAGAAATKAHDAEHEFSDKVWTHLRSEAGVAGGDTHDDD